MLKLIKMLLEKYRNYKKKQDARKLAENELLQWMHDNGLGE